MNTVYMDNNATTRVAPEVVEVMLPYYSDLYGNPSSMHTFGGQVGRAVEEARGKIASLLGAQPGELIFTSCGTESDSTAILSALQSFPEKRHIVTTRVEHPAVKNLCESLDKLTGHKHRITQLPVNSDGTLDLALYEESLSDETAIVSAMWANNETGVIFPIKEMAEIAKSRGILFHTDAVQAVGKIPIDLSQVPIDFLSLSGHKLHAPKGIGVLYVRKGTPFVPFIIGGHQEHGRRGGTENVASIVGLGKACELAARQMHAENTKVKTLRDKLENGLLARIPELAGRRPPDFPAPARETRLLADIIGGPGPLRLRLRPEDLDFLPLGRELSPSADANFRNLLGEIAARAFRAAGSACLAAMVKGGPLGPLRYAGAEACDEALTRLLLAAGAEAE